MSSLEWELAESKSKLENLSSTQLLVYSTPIKPKNDKVYIPQFRRNHKEKTNFIRLDKGKKFDIDAKISKPVSKPIASLQKKIDFVPTYHHCYVVGHIRPNCSLLRQDPKPMTWAPSRNIDVLKFVLVC